MTQTPPAIKPNIVLVGDPELVLLAQAECAKQNIPCGTWSERDRVPHEETVVLYLGTVFKNMGTILEWCDAKGVAIFIHVDAEPYVQGARNYGAALVRSFLQPGEAGSDNYIRNAITIVAKWCFVVPDAKTIWI